MNTLKALGVTALLYVNYEFVGIPILQFIFYVIYLVYAVRLFSDFTTGSILKVYTAVVTFLVVVTIITNAQEYMISASETVAYLVDFAQRVSFKY